jgi:hypothetical protein
VTAGLQEYGFSNKQTTKKPHKNTPVFLTQPSGFLGFYGFLKYKFSVKKLQTFLSEKDV